MLHSVFDLDIFLSGKEAKKVHETYCTVKLYSSKILIKKEPNYHFSRVKIK